MACCIAALYGARRLWKRKRLGRFPLIWNLPGKKVEDKDKDKDKDKKDDKDDPKNQMNRTKKD